MIERELEIIDRAVDESSDVAIELANLRDALDGKSADEIKQTLSDAIERIDALADVLTALSIDLAHVNRTLTDDRSKEAQT